MTSLTSMSHIVTTPRHVVRSHVYTPEVGQHAGRGEERGHGGRHAEPGRRVQRRQPVAVGQVHVSLRLVESDM